MKAVKKNQDFQNELFGFVALTLTLSDFAYFAAIYLTSSRPWLSLGLAALFPAVNVPALKLSVRTGKSYISYTLLLTLIPMFLVTYFSGPQSAAWLMCFSGMFASHVMCHGEHLKKCLVIGFVAAALLGSFSGGSSIAQLGIISVALASYALVSTRIFSFMRTQNEKLGLQITEREAAEMKIRAMSDASHDAMIMINGQGEVMFWNAAAEEMFGYTAEEARGTDMHTLFVPQKLRDAAHEGLRQFVQTGRGPVIGSVIEQKALGRDSRPFPVEIAVSSFKLGDGWHAVGSVRDITERKAAEQALNASEMKYRELVESANSIILKLDTQGRITFFNEYAQKFFGYAADEIIGCHIAGTLIPSTDSDGQDMSRLIEGIVRHPERYEHNENENTCKDGTRVWVSWTNQLIFDEHNRDVTGLLCVGIDITEAKKTRDERNEAFEVITSSIRYASRIQRSVLPDSVQFDNTFGDYFILWEPRDSVGGDIYFHKPWGVGKLIALADCTGHGVPGAFMSMIANGALDQAVMETPPGDCAILLQRCHQLIQTALGQTQKRGDSDDGLEMGLCYIAPRNRKMVFGGARFSLFVAADGDVTEIKGDKKYGLGYRATPHNTSFSNRNIEIGAARTFYMTSDGLIDQIGGPKRRSFGKKRFKRLLLEIDSKPWNERGGCLLEALEHYQGDERRRDDVSVLGFSFS